MKVPSLISMKRIISMLLATLTLIVFSIPLVGCDALVRKSDPVEPHLIAYEDREKNPQRPINDNAVSEIVFGTDKNDALTLQLDELLLIVMDNRRPSFSTNQDPKVKRVYDSAIKVLDRYILNDFSVFERVHAIHDYLVSAIKYDEELYLEHLDNPDLVKEDDPSFTLEGVFLDGEAVCTGFSKAFRLLCGIEGIKTEAVPGLFAYNGSQIPHIWNKVEIDSNWYNVDCTMDSITFYPTNDDPIEVIHHGYFLLSDDSLIKFGGHIFGGGIGYSATKDYGFHSLQEVFPNASYKMQVNTVDELNAVFKYIKSQKRKYGQVELKLNLGLNTTEANLPDAYSNEISDAYSIIKNKDFSYNTKNNRIPFQKYPNGVFVFLIYK